MAQSFKLRQATNSAQSVPKSIFKSFQGTPLLAWVFFFLGLLGLLLTQTQNNGNTVRPDSGGTALSAPIDSTKTKGIHQVFLWMEIHPITRDLLREMSIAAIISFFLAVFLEEPLREQTIKRVGQDIAPFLIAALTVPEMRYKMRQICEYAVIRQHSRLVLWIVKGNGEGGVNSYHLKVQMRSRYVNVSNTKKSVRANVVLDDDRNGAILGLSLRKINLPGTTQEVNWSGDIVREDGRQKAFVEIDFPKCDDWEESYIEGTSEYQEEITFIANTARNLFESLWPLVGIEVECVQCPDDITIDIEIPFSTIDRIDRANRWISTTALLPGERLDIVLRRISNGKPEDAPAEYEQAAS